MIQKKRKKQRVEGQMRVSWHNKGPPLVNLDEKANDVAKPRINQGFLVIRAAIEKAEEWHIIKSLILTSIGTKIKIMPERKHKWQNQYQFLQDRYGPDKDCSSPETIAVGLPFEDDQAFDLLCWTINMAARPGDSIIALRQQDFGKFSSMCSHILIMYVYLCVLCICYTHKVSSMYTYILIMYVYFCVLLYTHF